MKIPLSIRQFYDEQKDLYSHLKKRVDDRIISLKDAKWHYESRIKSQESYTLKLETGRFKNPRKLEDYFACTIVVENIKAVAEAEIFVTQEFVKQERRPKQDCFTHKRSDSFPFDDLRIYVKWKDDPTLPPSGLCDLIFEIQIKTFLQHAWSIATHDFIYKNDDVNWGKERIAYQIKAMLEHAELSILEADKIASSSVLEKTNKETNELSDIVNILKECWDSKGLPSDIVRLSRNVMSLIHAIGINSTKLKEVIVKETEIGKGTNILSLSPYGIILQSLLNSEEGLMCQCLTADETKFKMLMTKELELPKTLPLEKLKNVIII